MFSPGRLQQEFKSLNPGKIILLIKFNSFFHPLFFFFLLFSSYTSPFSPVILPSHSFSSSSFFNFPIFPFLSFLPFLFPISSLFSLPFSRFSLSFSSLSFPLLSLSCFFFCFPFLSSYSPFSHFFSSPLSTISLLC